ncbi:hypothetical protein [Clostridium nigeriense]|uniref:hypothetical protein n=1 Tax=Clostridium nigeriense TaxID=1805470 RepID=UPI000831B690|nr:hypothetical protein [Clostridium nigeriense]
MRKFKRLIRVMLMGLFIINFLSTTIKVKADDEIYYNDSYYIKNVNLSIEVNDKKQFFITEVIDAYFNKASEGIRRDIRLSNMDDKWEISDVLVEGASVEMDSYGGNICLRLGDANELIEGDKRYVIKYTLNYYDDEEEDGDYIDLDLLDYLNTKVEKFKAEIRYIDEWKYSEMRLINRSYENIKNNLARYYVKDNKIIIESTNVNSIILQGKLSNGTFKNAPLRKYPYFVNNDSININITKSKDYIIERNFEINVSGDSFYPYDDYITLWKGNFEDIISDVNISNSEVEIVDDIYMKIPKTPGNYKFTVTYKVRPDIKKDSKFILKGISNYYCVKNLTVNISSEVPILDNIITFGRESNPNDTEKYFLKSSSNFLQFKNFKKIAPSDEVSIILNNDNTLFSREDREAEKDIIKISIFTGIISCALFFILKKKGYLFSWFLSILMLILSYIPILKLHMEIYKFSTFIKVESLSLNQAYVPIILMAYVFIYFGYKSIINNKITFKTVKNIIIAYGIFIGFMLIEINKFRVNILFSTFITIVLSTIISLSLAVFILKMD